MSALAIFICHDCEEATKEPGNESSNHWAVVGPMADRVFEVWKRLHPGHDVTMHSDAHGQYSEYDYNFKTRELDFNL